MIIREEENKKKMVRCEFKIHNQSILIEETTI